MGITGERRGRVKPRSMYKGPWTSTMGWGMSLGVGVGWDRGEQWGGKMGTTVTEQQ